MFHGSRYIRKFVVCFIRDLGNNYIPLWQNETSEITKQQWEEEALEARRYNPMTSC